MPQDSLPFAEIPKIESFATNCFLLFRGITRLDEELNLVPQQLAIWVGQNYLITVHIGPSVSLDHMIQAAPGEMLLQSPNILALHLLHYAAGRYL